MDANLGLGEQALGKVAEMGIASQLDEAEKLNVELRTNPLKILQGTVESLSIEGEGLVMQQDLRMQELSLQMGKITVDTSSALSGNLELKQPVQAKARIVLTESDVSRLFNSETIRAQLSSPDAQMNGQPVTLELHQVECHLLGSSQLQVEGEAKIRETGERLPVAFTATAQVSGDRQGVVIQQLQYVSGKELPSALTEALQKKVGEILTLVNFQIKGMALTIEQLEVNVGEMIFHTEAIVRELPSA